ncbi:MAG: XdhC family protein [Parvularculales bacterium]
MVSGHHSPDPQQEPLRAVLDWLEEGHRVALATVTRTWGSAPCPAGSQLAVRDDGSFVGSVSGGCIEGDVIVRAQEVMSTGKAVLQDYGVSNTAAWAVGLACGGQIAVYIEPVTED